MPSSDPGLAFYAFVTKVIADAVSGTTIRYTTNGTTPTSSSPQYTKALSMATGTTLQARWSGGECSVQIEQNEKGAAV